MAEYFNPLLPLRTGVEPFSISTGIPAGGQAEISGYLHSLRTQGFCCIERVIPDEQVDRVRASVQEGYRLIKEAIPHGTWNVVPRAAQAGDDDVKPMHPPAINQICFNPEFREHLVNPRMLAVAQAMLDTHVRISQTETEKGRPANSQQIDWRFWHSDWPHDLSAYGPSDAEPWRHCGAVRQPFPDVCMALSTVWFLGPDDVSSTNGGESLAESSAAHEKSN